MKAGLNKGADGLAVFDLVIIGGGINGVGVARDAALRGLSVCLFDKGDLGSSTSSASTKLVHGGLRYLEYGAFSLVRSSLQERALLMDMLPGFIRPLRFIMPLKRGMLPGFLIRLGLWVYDFLGPRGELSRSRSVSLRYGEFGTPLKSNLKRGFEYSDCSVDDARLVILTALDATGSGAQINPYVKVVSARREEKRWVVTLEDGSVVYCRALINAAGPFVNKIIDDAMETNAPFQLRLVRGSHVVVPKLYDHDRAYILPQSDGRIVFTIPFERKFTLIGTTEVEHKGSLDEVSASPSEIKYLIDAINVDFQRQLSLDDVVWHFSGVRPLFDDGIGDMKSASREYKLALDGALDLPVIHIYGGKITVFRKVSEAVVDMLQPFLRRFGGSITDTVPYAAFEPNGFDEWAADLKKAMSFVPPVLFERWLRSYGRRAEWFLRDVKNLEDLGMSFGGGLFEREVRYLIASEWARSADDILWRRTKCGLHMSGEEREQFADWMMAHDGSSGLSDEQSRQNLKN